MEFFQQMLTKLGDANAALDSPTATDEQRYYAAGLADEVFVVAEDMGGGILGDVDDQLIKQAESIRAKLAK